MAVVISVAVGFYGIYHRVASARPDDNDILDDSHIDQHYREVLEQFRGFLRSLMMHAGVGTALGGVMTMVGEPQNLIIAKAAGWHFGEFFLRMAPVTLPVMICGLLTCLLLEKTKRFGYGEPLPPAVRKVLQEFRRSQPPAAQPSGSPAADCSGDYRHLAGDRAGDAPR